MTIAREAPAEQVEEAPSPSSAASPRDLQQTFRLLLATVWLMDAALQLQPFMFTKGSIGFSGMLNGLAAFGGRSSLKSWIYAIVVNRAVVKAVTMRAEGPSSTSSSDARAR